MIDRSMEIAEKEYTFLIENHIEQRTLGATKMGKHRDKWSREVISRLLFLGQRIKRIFPLHVEMEHKVHRGFIDVAWYISTQSHAPKKIYIAVFEIETSKSDWPRIRNNASKIVSLKPLLSFHIFKPSVRLRNSEREELTNIHHGRNVFIINSEREIDDMIRNLSQAFSGRVLIREITLHLPQPYLKAIDCLVENGYYLSRREALRTAIREMLEIEFGVSWENTQAHSLEKGCPNCHYKNGLLDIKKLK